MSEHFLCGFHAVTGELRRAASNIKQIYLERTRDDGRIRNLVQLAQSRDVRLVYVERSRLEGMAGGVRHQGVAAELRGSQPQRGLFETLGEIRPDMLLLGLDGVQDPRNLGACMRTADAYGVRAVFAPKDRAAGMTATASKAACGAAVPFFAVTNLSRTMSELRDLGMRLVGAAHDAPRDIREADLSAPLTWVLGAEEKGLRRLTRERCDELVRIPVTGQVGSLNLAVACGICLYETWRRGAR